LLVQSEALGELFVPGLRSAGGSNLPGQRDWGPPTHSQPISDEYEADEAEQHEVEAQEDPAVALQAANQSVGLVAALAHGAVVLPWFGAHAGQAVPVRSDLQDFFSSIRASRVHALFATLGYTDEVARALTALCTLATPEAMLARWHAEGGLLWTQRQRLRDAHLAQGAATSPALANLCAFGLDLRLQGLAHSLGARYTRYADDIVLSGPAHLQSCRARIRTWVVRLVAEQGFSLNTAKTRLARANQRQQVCGIVVNERPNLAREDFDRLRAVLHRCVRHGPEAANTGAHPDWREHLSGRVAWAAQLNPGKAVRLQRLLAGIDWNRPASA
jgi:hypothetical protein